MHLIHREILPRLRLAVRGSILWRNPRQLARRTDRRTPCQPEQVDLPWLGCQLPRVQGKLISEIDGFGNGLCHDSDAMSLD
ncbi:MAG: hypothetical protein CM1200mP25_0790 [Acidobacteriota bacterium]|nr:MAG: hypothetical protein CM1200mP25_0790 [Acidobacteriota bacterium]